MIDTVLRVTGIKKTFPGVQALNWEPDEAIEVRAGEVRGLIGENGAGKSTLGQIIAGVYAKDAGEMWVKGQPYEPASAVDAHAKGVAIVLQESALLPSLTIADNLFLGEEASYSRYGLLSLVRRNQLASQLIKNFGLDISPATPIRRLNFEEQKLIELLKATYVRPHLLIIDETAAALSHHGKTLLFSHLENLKQAGCAVIYITHTLEEVIELCDTVTVMKDGKLVATMAVKDTDINEMSTLMVGRELSTGYFRQDKTESWLNRVALSVEHLSSDDYFQDISFEVRKGEILGFGGLVGSGTEEIGRALFGDFPITAGVIRREGEVITPLSPGKATRYRIGNVPKNRDKEGIILKASVKRNITLPILNQFVKMGLLLYPRKETEVARRYIERLRIKTPDPDTYCLKLSGGNRQKVVVAKWLAAKADVLVLNSPTRGVDIGAKAEIYKLMTMLKKEGLAMIMISEELPELIGMSDRIILIRRGKISGEFLRSARLSEENLIQYMV